MTPPTKEEIRAARQAAGLTQTQAGALLHTTVRVWQQWEAGDRKMHSAFWELFNIKTAATLAPLNAADRLALGWDDRLVAAQIAASKKPII